MSGARWRTDPGVGAFRYIMSGGSDAIGVPSDSAVKVEAMVSGAENESEEDVEKRAQGIVDDHHVRPILAGWVASMKIALQAIAGHEPVSVADAHAMKVIAISALREIDS